METNKMINPVISSGNSFRIRIKNSVLVAALFLAGTAKLWAEDIPVNSVTALQTAINKAKAGDRIVLANGIYQAAENIVISNKGTADKPITIMAQMPGKAEIAGKGGFNLVSPAAHIVIQGFKFTHEASKAKSGSGTAFCRWTQNIFETPGDGEDLTIAGNDQEVDHNTFQNKNAMGRFIAIRGTGSQIAERLWIHHNYFNNAVSQGGKNGAEAFQFGLSGFSLSSSKSIVEYNLFERCAGENELISVKASAVTLRYNTIRDCPAQFTLRHGNYNRVYGNYFIQTPGLRIFGDDHLVYSNYFENCEPAITIGNGGAEVADGAALTSHDRPDRVLIAFNTLINNPQNIVQTPRKEGIGATYITVANNIIQGGGAAASISGPCTNMKWEGNLIFNVKNAGDMPSAGYVMKDPRLAKNASGIFHIQPGSPAKGGAVGAYPSVEVDIDGQARKAPLDAGADQINVAATINPVLKPTDVGFGTTK